MGHERFTKDYTNDASSSQEHHLKVRISEIRGVQSIEISLPSERYLLKKRKPG